MTDYGVVQQQQPARLLCYDDPNFKAGLELGLQPVEFICTSPGGAMMKCVTFARSLPMPGQQMDLEDGTTCVVDTVRHRMFALRASDGTVKHQMMIAVVHAHPWERAGGHDEASEASSSVVSPWIGTAIVAWVWPAGMVKTPRVAEKSSGDTGRTVFGGVGDRVVGERGAGKADQKASEKKCFTK